MSNSFIQPSSISPASCIAFTSYSSASVTTSASFPFATSSACLPLPPCDCITSMSCPVCPFQCSAKSSLYALYNSLVGSYDTFVIVTDFSVLVSALFPQPALAYFKSRQAAKYRIDATQADYENKVHPIS